MSSLKTKWEKGLRTYRLRAQAQTLIVQARRAGRQAGPILVTCLAQMGDVILCAGVAAELRQRHPEAPLVMAIQPTWQSLLQEDPLLDGVLTAQSFYEVRALATTGLFEAIYVLDIPMPSLLHYFDGVSGIFRYAPPTTGDWFQHGKNLMALYEQNAGLAEGQAHPRVYLTPPDIAAAKQVRQQLQDRDDLGCSGPIVAVHTQSSEDTKNWPQEKFAALITRWHRSYRAGFIILGGPGEAGALSALPGVLNVAGKISLRQTAAVIAESDLFLGLDSGLAYLAEAAGTPGVIILGATTSETCGPRRHDLFSFVRAESACLPACHRVCTREPFCITDLEVDAVDRALQMRWDRQRGKVICR